MYNVYTDMYIRQAWTPRRLQSLSRASLRKIPPLQRAMLCYSGPLGFDSGLRIGFGGILYFD